MTAVELLAECRARNIVLEPNGGQLDIDAAAGALTDELLQRLRDCKSALLALLSDGGGYEREERDAIVWCETGPAHEVQAALQEAIDWFDAMTHGDAGQDLTAVPPDPDLAAALATLTPADLAHYRTRLAARREAGEPDPGREWRALVDVRVDRGHWPAAPVLRQDERAPGERPESNA